MVIFSLFVASVNIQGARGIFSKARRNRNNVFQRRHTSFYRCFEIYNHCSLISRCLRGKSFRIRCSKSSRSFESFSGWKEAASFRGNENEQELKQVSINSFPSHSIYHTVFFISGEMALNSIYTE